MKTLDLLAAVQKVADDHYDGHWSLFSFTSGFKAAFGTPMDDFREVVWNIETSSTVEDALQKLLELNSSLYQPTVSPISENHRTVKDGIFVEPEHIEAQITEWRAAQAVRQKSGKSEHR